MDRRVITQRFRYGLGIGYEFEHNDKRGRIAVYINGELTPEKLENTFKYLNKILENPDDSKNILWGNNTVLVGCEMPYEDIEMEESEKEDDLLETPFILKEKK